MTDEERLADFEAQAERAHAEMYEVHHSADITARYSEAKESLRTAIGLARSLGRDDDVKRLEARLGHIVAVFRSQFAQLT